MRYIKVIYDNGSNGILKLSRRARKQHKRLSDMASAELTELAHKD